MRIKEVLLKSAAPAALMVSSLTNAVYADGSLSGTLGKFSTVIAKVSPLINTFITLAVVACIIFSVVKLVFQLIKWKQAENPQEENTAKKAAMGYGIAAIIAIVAIPVINILLTLLDPSLGVFNFNF